jgi:endonuclease-3
MLCFRQSDWQPPDPNLIAKSGEHASLLHIEDSNDRIIAHHQPFDRKKGMSTSIIPTIHLARVYEKLIATYGEPKNEPDNDPLGGLIATILSQHTSDINSGRAYQQLVTAFPIWEYARDAATDKIAEAIKCGGLANIKSVRIQDVLHTLTEQEQEQGETKTLAEYLYDELAKRTTEEAWRYLRKLPGVGPKTAACVLMFHLDRPAFPIDTHVWRTARRLGLIGPKVSADLAHTLFAKVTPPEWVYPLHVNLIRHGRQTCHAQRPACKACPLYDECAYVGSVNAQETAIPSI